MLGELRGLVASKVEGALEQVQDLAGGDLYDVMDSPVMNVAVENPNDDGLFALTKKFLWERVANKIPLLGTGIKLVNWMSDRWNSMGDDQKAKVNLLYLKLIGREKGPITLDDIPDFIEGSPEKISMLNEIRRINGQ